MAMLLLDTVATDESMRCIIPSTETTQRPSSIRWRMVWQDHRGTQGLLWSGQPGEKATVEGNHYRTKEPALHQYSIVLRITILSEGWND